VWQRSERNILLLSSAVADDRDTFSIVQRVSSAAAEAPLVFSSLVLATNIYQ